MEGGLINPLALIRTGAAEGVTSTSAEPSDLKVERKRLVLDANILIRGCLGIRVNRPIASCNYIWQFGSQISTRQNLQLGIGISSTRSSANKPSQSTI